MTFNLVAILGSKRAYRSRLAALPIAEKLRLLDALRERAITLRRAGRTAKENGAAQPAPAVPEPAPDANDPYKALKTMPKAKINEEAWEMLNGNTSWPFPKPRSGRIAVKVINHPADEVMKVFRVG